jgi:tryptophan 2,3-dioxygenase
MAFRQENRSRYNQANYMKVFADPNAADLLQQSETEPSLCDLVQRWLERTPGLEENGFNFWRKYQSVVEEMLETEEHNALVRGG